MKELNEKIKTDERKRVCGVILHFLIASKQEIINDLLGRADHKGIVRVTKWQKCVEEIIDWVRKLYSKGVKWDDEFVCYHVTTKDRLGSIMEEGLKPNAEPNWFESPTPYVMLSRYPYWELYEKDMILLEIKHPEILPEYFADPEGLRWGTPVPPEYILRVVAFNVIGKNGGVAP